MKKVILSVITVLLLVSAANAAELTTEKQKTGYAIGLNFAMMLSQQMAGIRNHMEMDAFIAGLTDGLLKKKLQLQPAELTKIMQSLQKKIQAEQAEKMKQNATKGKENLEKGKAFEEANKKKAGVKVTSSGLQYRVIKPGNGAKPTLKDTVKVNYEGKLIDGKIFDSSYKRGQPVSFPLNGVIKGWQEGLQLMNEGAEYEFVIPANIAYGARAPQEIGPNSTLVFKVELIKVNPKK